MYEYSEKYKTTMLSLSFLIAFDYSNSYTISVVRDQLGEEYENLKYGNISQTYSFTIDIDFKRLGLTVGKKLQLPNEKF